MNATTKPQTQARNNFPKEIDLTCRSIGAFIEYWGFKEIEGRLWCHLLLSKEPLCAQDLINRTAVSKALVSISINRLIEFNVIEVDHVKFRRTQYFNVNQNVSQVIKGVLRSRELILLKDSLSKAKALKSLPPSKLVNVDLKSLNFLIKMIKIGETILML
jgi:DNA-binding transcriptional regulator GbsR (MarR family)